MIDPVIVKEEYESEAWIIKGNVLTAKGGKSRTYWRDMVHKWKEDIVESEIREGNVSNEDKRMEKEWE